MYLFNGICCHEEIPDKLKKYSQQRIVAKKTQTPTAAYKYHGTIIRISIAIYRSECTEDNDIVMNEKDPRSIEQKKLCLLS